MEPPALGEHDDAMPFKALGSRRPDGAVTSVMPESLNWVDALGSAGARREDAAVRLHALLLGAAQLEVRRRCEATGGVPTSELEDLATQASDDAVVAILEKLHTFRGQSRFTTWAYKFVLREAAVKVRRRSWQGRDVSLSHDSWPALVADGSSPQQVLEDRALLDLVRRAVETALTPHQQEVFSALALNGVPIDVLAERLDSTRGALYETLHDARRIVRDALAAAGHPIGDEVEPPS
jgi:RNA polymerase sigma-70 factor, ECF subfamily